MPVVPIAVFPYTSDPEPGPPGLKVQIVAYIEQVFGPDDVVDVHDDSQPNESRGFVTDVIIFVRVSDGKSVKHCLVDHYGSEDMFPTYEDAQREIHKLSGVTVERIPGIEELEIPKFGTLVKRVGRTVVEFEPNDKSFAQVEEDVPGPKMPKLWEYAGSRFVVPANKKRKVPTLQ